MQPDIIAIGASAGGVQASAATLVRSACWDNRRAHGLHLSSNGISVRSHRQISVSRATVEHPHFDLGQGRRPPNP